MVMMMMVMVLIVMMLMVMILMVMVTMLMVMVFSLANQPVVECPSNAEFAFADFQFDNTLVTEWDLVCSQDYKVPLVVHIGDDGDVDHQYNSGVPGHCFLHGRPAELRNVNSFSRSRILKLDFNSRKKCKAGKFSSLINLT